eukprot:3274433-Amphidinium_carterae.2
MAGDIMILKKYSAEAKGVIKEGVKRRVHNFRLVGYIRTCSIGRSLEGNDFAGKDTAWARAGKGAKYFGRST